MALYETMNGKPELSNYILKKISLEKKISDSKNFLFAYNYFILDDYSNFHKHLNLIKSKNYETLQKTCHLKLYKGLVHQSPVKDEKSCQKIIENTSLFLKTLNFLRLTDNDSIQKIIDKESRDVETVQEAKTILKSSIFSGNEDFILDYITLLPKKIFKYSSIRELLGIIFFRLRDFNKTEKLIRPVDTVNAKNILGNIELEKGNIDIAYGYFLEAYKKDHTSLNAIKKLIPLSWKLGKFELLSKLIKIYEKDSENKSLISSASLLKQRKYKESLRALDIKNKVQNINPPLINVLLKLALNFHLDRTTDTIKLSKQACKRNNPIACDILYYTHELKTVTKLKKVTSDIHETVEIDIKGLQSEIETVPLKEVRLVDQKDIEELDDQVQFKQSLKK